MDDNDVISKIGNQPYGDFNNNTPSQNDKNPLKETDDRIFLAKLMCLGISILGVVMLFVSLFTNQIVQVYISIAYSVTMALTFVSILTTKKLTIFYPVCFVFFFALEIGFMITGGSDGFGILWITIIPIFGIHAHNSNSHDTFHFHVHCPYNRILDSYKGLYVPFQSGFYGQIPYSVFYG